MAGLALDMRFSQVSGFVALRFFTVPMRFYPFYCAVSKPT